MVQVYFVGTEAKIDMRPSSVWLKEKTANWPFQTHLKIGVKRDEALEILSEEGTLLVLCSLIDNMPYVVAEAAVSFRPKLPLLPGRSCCYCPVMQCHDLEGREERRGWVVVNAGNDLCVWLPAGEGHSLPGF